MAEEPAVTVVVSHLDLIRHGVPGFKKSSGTGYLGSIMIRVTAKPGYDYDARCGTEGLRILNSCLTIAHSIGWWPQCQKGWKKGTKGTKWKHSFLEGLTMFGKRGDILSFFDWNQGILARGWWMPEGMNVRGHEYLRWWTSEMMNVWGDECLILDFMKCQLSWNVKCHEM